MLHTTAFAPSVLEIKASMFGGMLATAFSTRWILLNNGSWDCALGQTRSLCSPFSEAIYCSLYMSRAGPQRGDGFTNSFTRSVNVPLAFKM